jgi:hypothetical protein
VRNIPFVLCSQMADLFPRASRDVRSKTIHAKTYTVVSMESVILVAGAATVTASTEAPHAKTARAK